MGDTSSVFKKYMTKRSESYEDPENGQMKKKKAKKARSGAYKPRGSKVAKQYKKMLDDATGW